MPKRKADDEPETSIAPLSLAGFQTQRVLRGGDNGGHQHVILGTLPAADAEERSPAIVIIKQKHFTSADVGSVLGALSATDALRLTMENNEYKYYEASSPAGAGMLGVEVIHPCTWWHEGKYTFKQVFLVEETPDDFRQITAPYIDALPPKKLQWVFDILEGKKEVDRVLVADPDPQTGFVLVMQPTMKDADDHNNAFYFAIARARGLRSLRDLDASHLPLLENIRDKSMAALERRHGLTRVDMRAFLHYQPSFFHLHVHFRALGRAADPSDVSGREFLLDEVMDNLRIDGEYYRKRTLAFTSAAHPKLANAFHAAEKKKVADKSKLLVLDVSILASIEGSGVTKRPELDSFLDFVFRHFKVASISIKDAAATSAPSEDSSAAGLADASAVFGQERTAQLLFASASAAAAVNCTSLASSVTSAGGSIADTLFVLRPDVARALAAAAATNVSGATAGETATGAVTGDRGKPQLSIIAPPACPSEPEGDDALSSGGELRRFLWSMRHVSGGDGEEPQALRRFVRRRDPFAAKEGGGEQGR